MIDIPPGKYFISHSYRDAEVRDDMITRLPKGVTPFIFPPIQVEPYEFVSNPLINAILMCDGLIVLEGGYSTLSFWVAFERDYGLMAGKEVYAYSPSNHSFKLLKPDSRVKPKLPIVAHYKRNDKVKVREIIEFMMRKRYFDIMDTIDLDWQSRKGIEPAIREYTDAGGYVVIFRSAVLQNDFADHIDFQLAKLFPNTLIALMAPSKTFGIDQSKLIPIYYDEQPTQINNNRLDDLIVRLYWQIHKNRQQR